MAKFDENGVDISDIELDRAKKPIHGVFPDSDELAAKNRCINCGKSFTDNERAQWSIMGQREWYISSCCEPCFDKMFKETDEFDEKSGYFDYTEED